MKNIVVNVSSQLFSIVIRFVCTTVFIQTLGVSYLGVNSLFSNILTLFSLAELGVGSAITFSMYQPLARNDRKKIGALMNLYRKAYHTIGFIVAAAGFSIAPFYRVFIKGDANIPNLTIIYFLYLFNSVITYFLSYKQTIITADQKNYVCVLYQNAFCIVQNILQIFVLYLTKNFILYLCIQILFSFLTNFSLSKKADKMYPYLKKYKDEKLNSSDRKKIIQNIQAMFMHKIGGVIVNGTDAILISSFAGLVSAGIYYFYNLIILTLNGVIQQIFNGITASIGNLGASEEDTRRPYHIYLSINFAGFWIFSFSAISLFCLFTPFIRLWTGKNQVFTVLTEFFIALNFYATGMRQATLQFKNAYGLFWYDRYKAIAEAVINLVVSIILVQYIGIAGVFLGTFISTVTTDLWVEPLVLFKHGFHRSAAPYFGRYLFYTVLTFAVGFLTWYSCYLVGGYSLRSFVLKCVICGILPNLIYYIIFCKTKEFQYLKGFLKIPKMKIKKKIGVN